MTPSIKLNGTEVQNPVARILVAMCAIAGVVALVSMLGFMIFPVILGLIMVTFIFTLPLHFILRLCGRRGFYIREGNIHSWKWKGAFNRR
jgi:hypothetical protein